MSPHSPQKASIILTFFQLHTTNFDELKRGKAYHINIWSWSSHRTNPVYSDGATNNLFKLCWYINDVKLIFFNIHLISSTSALRCSPPSNFLIIPTLFHIKSFLAFLMVAILSILSPTSLK